MVYLGIDPGITGGLALIDAKAKVLWALKMPDTNRKKINLLSHALGMPGGLLAALEFVRSRPGQGAPATFTFGRGYGHLEMLLDAGGVTYLNPTPQTWQKKLNCRSGGDKRVTLRAARKLFGPDVNHTTADALLLAEFARRHSLDL